MINAGCAPPRGRELGRPKRINKEMPEAVRFPSLGRWFRNDRFAPPFWPLHKNSPFLEADILEWAFTRFSDDYAPQHAQGTRSPHSL